MIGKEAGAKRGGWTCEISTLCWRVWANCFGRLTQIHRSLPGSSSTCFVSVLVSSQLSAIHAAVNGPTRLRGVQYNIKSILSRRFVCNSPSPAWCATAAGIYGRVLTRHTQSLNPRHITLQAVASITSSTDWKWYWKNLNITWYVSNTSTAYRNLSSTWFTVSREFCASTTGARRITSTRYKRVICMSISMEHTCKYTPVIHLKMSPESAHFP